MVRNLLAVVAALVAVVIVVAGIELAGHRLFPAATPMVAADPDAMRDFVQSLPVGALLMVVLAWTLGAFVGSAVAIRLAVSQHALLAWFVGGLVLAMVGTTVWQIPHPGWMVAAGVVLPLVAVAIAVHLFAPRPAPPPSL